MKNQIELKGMKLSHAKAFMNVSYPKELVSDYEVNSIDEDMFNNRIVKKTIIKTVHPQDKFAGMKASDFALENIIAVGALDSLTECKLNYGTRGEISDNVEGTIDNVISAVDSAESETIKTDE